MRRVGWRVGALLGFAALLSAALGYAWLDVRVEEVFRLATSAAPSRLYSRPLVLRRGIDPFRDGVAEHLDRAGYRLVSGPAVRSGEYAFRPSSWRIGIRRFDHPGGTEPGKTVVLRLDAQGMIAGLELANGESLRTARIEPSEIGVFLSAEARDRIPLKLDDVPRYLVDAILVTEDRRFFRHLGIDLPRVAGALLANLRAGRVVQGASTITQQLAKGMFLSRERTLGRKLREFVIALVLERRYSKEEILQAYLNQIYLGQDGSVAIHGVGLAARHYFGRDVRELDLAEAALLAGVIRSPSSHSPLLNLRGARVRRNLVLDSLLREGRIGEIEHAVASAAPIDLRPDSLGLRSASYFVDYLRKPLVREFGERALESGGLKIFATLDLTLQTVAERVVRRQLEWLEDGARDLKQENSPLQASMVVMEPRTGQILALVGGRDYAQSPFDRATRARRQPGSVFKPVVALAALSRQAADPPAFTLASLVSDAPLRIRMPGKRWAPANHDRRFRGDVTVRQSLEQSLNVPMTRLATAVGLDRVISTARRLGVESPLEFVPSLPLGTFEVTLIEMVRAYSVLASDGVRAPLRGVLSVMSPNGEAVALPHVPPLRVFQPAETYLVTSALQGAVDRGTSTTLRDLGYYGAVAGKTGSTNGFRDALFVAYTPEVALGVWVGFDLNRSIGLSGSSAALPIAADFLIRVIGRRGGRHFRPPAGLERAEVSILQGTECRRIVEHFLSGTVPSDQCERRDTAKARSQAGSGG
jgi:penicillin-binding protein 1B